MARVKKSVRMAASKSAAMYRAFREADPKRAKRVTLKLPKAVMIIGYCNAIEYDTTHAGTERGYRHKFARGSRPMLCAGPGRGQLYLIGGRFHFTGRGIVDLTPSGKEIED